MAGTAAYEKPVQTPLVMTVIGRDRPGLVEQLARLIAARGGNWLASRMCRLGGEFAGILRVEVPAAEREALMATLHDLASEGLTVVVQADRPEETSAEATLALLDLVGQDRPGIVREVSAALARQSINVEELSTECASAPMSGETLFHARARLRLPAGCEVASLRRELEQIAADLQVDLSIEPWANEPAPSFGVSSALPSSNKPDPAGSAA